MADDRAGAAPADIRLTGRRLLVIAGVSEEMREALDALVAELGCALVDVPAMVRHEYGAKARIAAIDEATTRERWNRADAYAHIGVQAWLRNDKPVLLSVPNGFDGRLERTLAAAREAGAEIGVVRLSGAAPDGEGLRYVELVGSGGRRGPGESERLLERIARLLPHTRRLVVVAGPAAGMRTVAPEVADDLGCLQLSARDGSGLMLCHAMLIGAGALLRLGQSVVVDGDFVSRDWRAVALTTARTVRVGAGIVRLAGPGENAVALYEALADEGWSWHVVCVHDGGRWKVKYGKDPDGVLQRLTRSLG